MPFSIRKLTRLHLLALCSVALFCLVGFSLGLPTWLRGSNGAATTAAPLEQQKTEAALDKPDRLVVQELLTLRSFGFDPPELTIPSGNFLLAIDNLSGTPNIDLTLVEEKKAKLKDIKIETRQRDWREEIDLKTGVYILSVVNQPTWVCRITVTDKVRGQ